MNTLKKHITRAFLLIGLVISTFSIGQNTSSSLDLYMKDRLEDIGDEEYPYHWQADRDLSIDIWHRRYPDGFENQENEVILYDGFSVTYIYVRVRNKSFVDASGNENLSLYWSKASSWSSWPQNWDGSELSVGNHVGSVNIGNLAAGNDTIFEFEWSMFDLYFPNWSVCFLARIEDSPTDTITIYPGRLDDDVYFNNNITMRNMSMINIVPWEPAIGMVDGIYYPHGKYMFVGNPQPYSETIDLSFSVPRDSLDPSILQFAEVKIIFDDLGWSLLEPHLINRNDLRILQEKEILLLTDSVLIPNIEFLANTRIPIFVGFSFLIDEISEEDQFKYHVRQYLSANNSLLGGVHYFVNRYHRSPFEADAGADKEIKEGEFVAIDAILINESAIYNWYNQEGDLIYEGSSFSISPEITRKYKLEVITDVDGYKDYDEVEVKVNPFWIENISPNPVSNLVTIDYVANKASSAYLMVLNQTSTQSNNYIIDTDQSQTSINLSAYNAGVYTLVLVCDGRVRDVKTLAIQ